MEAEQVNSVSRLVATQPRPQGEAVDGGSPPAPDSGNATPPVQDTVTLSAQGRQAVKQEGSGEGGNAQVHRQLDVTDSNQVVLKILDATTQQVVKQIPPEEQVKLRQAIQNVVDAQAQTGQVDVTE